MKHSGLLHGGSIAILIVLAYVIPYTVLSDIHAWYGSFLWWGLSALVVIGISFIATKEWSK